MMCVKLCLFLTSGLLMGCCSLSPFDIKESGKKDAACQSPKSQEERTTTSQSENKANRGESPSRKAKAKSFSSQNKSKDWKQLVTGNVK